MNPTPVSDQSTDQRPTGPSGRKPGPERVGPVNMRDVARRAGVSVSTVSRVVGGSAAVQAKTRDLVLEAMAELDYVVNGLAQSMLGTGSRTIGFLVSHMVGPTFAELASGVEQEASKAGDLLAIVTTHRNPNDEWAALRQLREQRAKAVLLVGAGETDAGYTERLRNYETYLSAVGTRLILCGRAPVDAVPGVLSVSYDNAAGIRAATQHLLDLGHRRILYLGAAGNHSTAEERLRGYLQALDAAGVSLDPSLFPETSFEPETCRAALESLTAAGTHFTAIVAARDEIAVHALRYFKQRGVRVPEDVSLVGFDDMPFMADLTPALTTVRVPYRELGRRAGELVESKQTAQKHSISLPTELIVRASTSKPKGH